MKLGSSIILAAVFLATFVSASSTLNSPPSQESEFSPSNSPPIARVLPEPMYILGVVNNMKNVLFDYADTIIACCVTKSTSLCASSFVSTTDAMLLPWLTTSVSEMRWVAVLIAAITLGALIGMTSTRLLLSKGYFYANDITYHILFGRLCDDAVLTGVLITGASRTEARVADYSRTKSHSLGGAEESTTFTPSFDEDLLAASTPSPDESGLLGTLNKAVLTTKDHHSEASRAFFHDTGLLDNILVDHAVTHLGTKPPASSLAMQRMNTSNSAELESARSNVSTVASDQSIGDLTLVESCAGEYNECELKEPEPTPHAQVLGIPCRTDGFFDIEKEASPVILRVSSPANQGFNRLFAQSDEDRIVELFQLLSLNSHNHTGEARLPNSSVHATPLYTA